MTDDEAAVGDVPDEEKALNDCNTEETYESEAIEPNDSQVRQ
jgi:hypothetical protein